MSFTQHPLGATYPTDILRVLSNLGNNPPSEHYYSQLTDEKTEAHKV